jgi:zinc-ribbon domain
MEIYASRREGNDVYCKQCGNEVEQHARFCSKCGQEVSAAATVAPPVVQPKKTEHDMNMHINILGWLLIGSGILTAIGGTVTLFVGQVFPRLPLPVGHDMPVGGPPFIGWIISMVAWALLVVAAATVAAGVGLLQYKSWARVFAIVISVLLLFHFPIGTAVAVYAFWVLFSQEGQRFYKSRSESTMTASGT